MQDFAGAIAGATLASWSALAALALYLLPIAALAAPSWFGGAAAAVGWMIDRVTGAALALAMVFGGLIVVLQLSVVLAGNLFGLAYPWLNELVFLAFAGFFMLGAAAALRDGAHVRVDILRARMGDRSCAWVDAAGAYLFILPICLLMMWAAEASLFRSIAISEGSKQGPAGLPLYYVYLRLLIPVFAGLLLAQGAAQAMKAALALRGLRPFDTDASEIGAA